jgi:hypothetical protein
MLKIVHDFVINFTCAVIYLQPKAYHFLPWGGKGDKVGPPPSKFLNKAWVKKFNKTKNGVPPCPTDFSKKLSYQFVFLHIMNVVMTGVKFESIYFQIWKAKDMFLLLHFDGHFWALHCLLTNH